MNQLRRIFPAALAVVLAACSGGNSNNNSGPTGLEPTRTSSPNTPAPRATRAPTATPAPQPTAKPLLPNAITIDSADALTTTATREERAPTQLYSVGAGGLLGISSRSFELLDAQTLQSKMTTPYAVSSDGTDSMFWYTASPDANIGATMDAQGKVTFYDLNSGKLSKTLPLEKPENTAQADIALSADGRELVYANGTVQRYSAETGEALGAPQTMPQATVRILFAEDASKLAAVQPDGNIVILDTRAVSPAAPVTLTPGFTTTNQFLFSPEGSWFGVADGQSKIELYHLGASSVPLTTTEPVTAPVTTTTPISPTESVTATATTSETVAPVAPTDAVTPTAPLSETEAIGTGAAASAEAVTDTAEVTSTAEVSATAGISATAPTTPTEPATIPAVVTDVVTATEALSQTAPVSETAPVTPPASTERTTITPQIIEVAGPALPVFDAQGTRVAVLNSGVVTVYALNGDAPAEEQVLSLSGDGVPTSAHFSPDGQTIYIASVGGIESFQVSDGALITSGMRLGFTRLLFTLDGKHVLSWGALTPSASVGVIDPATGDVVSQLKHETPVRFVTLSPTGQYAATATRDGGTHVWRLSDETQLLTITAATNNERRGAVCFTPDEKGLVMIEGTDIVIEPLGSGVRRRFALPENVLNLAGCGNAKGTLAFIGENEVNIADLTGKILGTIALPSDATDLRDAALYQFSNDGRYFAGMSATALYIWDTATQELLHTIELRTPPIFGFEFSPNDAKIAVNFGEAAQLVDVATGEVTTLEVPTSPAGRWLTVLFTADPNTVLTVAMVSDEATAVEQVTARTYVSGEITVWDATTGQAVRSIETSEPLYAAAINADGTVLATGSQNNTLSLWALK